MASGRKSLSVPPWLIEGATSVRAHAIARDVRVLLLLLLLCIYARFPRPVPAADTRTRVTSLLFCSPRPSFGPPGNRIYPRTRRRAPFLAPNDVRASTSFSIAFAVFFRLPATGRGDGVDRHTFRHGIRTCTFTFIYGKRLYATNRFPGGPPNGGCVLFGHGVAFLHDSFNNWRNITTTK